jgi:TolA-binding protein
MMEFLTSPVFVAILRVAGVMSAAATGYLAYRYFKQAGGQESQSRLNAMNKDTISALESRIRLLQTTIEDLEKTLKRTGEELTRALERVKELIQEQEMIG